MNSPRSYGFVAAVMIGLVYVGSYWYLARPMPPAPLPFGMRQSASPSKWYSKDADVNAACRFVFWPMEKVWTRRGLYYTLRGRS